MSMKTQAAVLYQENRPFVVETLQLAPPQTGEVLIKMAAAGVCHSDWHVVTGDTKTPMPVVLGHEGAGVVESIGPEVTRFKAGDHVILNWTPSCGCCFYCLHDRPNLCSTYLEPLWAGTMLDGTGRLSKDSQTIYHLSAVSCFAEYAVVPEQCCVPLSKEVSFSIGALIGCAVSTGVGAVLNTAQVRPGSSVAVFGAGGVGLNIIMGARLAGAGPIIAVDRFKTKLDMALDFGASDALIAGQDTNEAIRQLTEGRGADYVFEAIGLPAVQEQCLDAVRPGGMVILAGLSPVNSATNLPGAIITRQEKTVAGTFYGTTNPARDFPFFIELYLKGKLDLERLITKTYSLDLINQAYADLLKGEIARGLITFD